MSDEFIDNTIAALKIIGMVPRSGKLCVRKGQLSVDDTDNLNTSLRRWFRGDSRDVTMMHARNAINNAIKISKALIEAFEKTELACWTLDRLVHEMEQCDVGLQNLKTTYANDAMMVANLDVLCDRLRAHKGEVKSFLSHKSQEAIAVWSVQAGADEK